MLWKKIKGFTYKTYIIFFLLLLAFLPVMTLGYYSYYTYVQHITEKVSISTNVAANQVKGRIDALLVDIRKNYMEVVEREEILWFLNQDVDYSDYTNLVDVTSNLQGNKYLMDYIDGYSIINFETQWILSNRGMYKYNELLNSQEVEALRNVQNQNLTRYLWLDHTESSKGEKLRREIVDLSGLSLVIQVPIRSTQPQGLVIININEDKLYNMMNELREGDMTILNGEGRVVYTSNEEVAQYCSVNIEKLASEESFRAKIKGSSNYIVATTDSEAIMWKYIASSNLDLVREGGNDIILLMVLLIGLMVLLIIGTKVFSGFIYGPILSLTQYVNQIMKNESIGKDIPAQKLEHREFEFLTHSITELADSKKSLEGLISNQKVQLMELFQLRLLEGDIKGDQLEAYRMQLNIVKKNYYMLVSIKLSMSSELGESTIVSEDAIEDAMRIDVVKNLPKELLDKLLIYPICNYETVSFVIGADDKEVLLSRVKESLDIFKQYVFEKYHFIINGGVSNRFEHLVDYRRAYYESIEALKQQRMWQTPERLSEVIFYGDTEKSDTYNYDVVLEKQIVEAVDNGQEEEAFSMVDQFIDALMSGRVLPNDYQMYLHRFLLALLSVLQHAGLATDTILKPADENIFLSFAKIYEVHKLKTFYKKQVISPIIKEISEYRSNQSGSILEAIKGLIRESHGDITLNECAQKLHYHPTYIWKVMKLEGERTFSDFIADYKLAEAKRLLDETSLTVAEIAQKLGYTNTQNFIRFFNKVEGVTPGKYRKAKGDIATNNKKECV